MKTALWLVLVVCLGAAAIQAQRVWRAHRVEAAKNPDLRADPAIEPALQVLSKLGVAADGTERTNASVLSRTDVLPQLNKALDAVGTGIAPEIMQRMSRSEARLVQWLMLHLGSDGLASDNPTATAARRHIHQLVFTALTRARLPATEPARDAQKVVVVGEAESLAEEERKRSAKKKIEVLNMATRLEQIQPAPLIAALGLKDGLQVLDIGAGAGLMSVPMSRAVTPTGRVWATDVDERMVALLKKTAAKSKLDNLEPTLVSPEGLDPFYTSRTFDRVLLVSVLEYIRQPIDFFARLRASLSSSAMVAIIQGKTSMHFLPSDFRQHFLREVLAAEPAKSPIRRAVGDLDKPPQQWAATFNALLNDDNFWREELRYRQKDRLLTGGDWSALEVYIADRLKSDPGADMDPVRKELTTAGTRALNWIALQRWFSLEPPRELFPKGIYRNERGMRRLFQAAGYKLVRSVNILIAHDVWLFSPVKQD